MINKKYRNKKSITNKRNNKPLKLYENENIENKTDEIQLYKSNNITYKNRYFYFYSFGFILLIIFFLLIIKLYNIYSNKNKNLIQKNNNENVVDIKNIEKIEKHENNNNNKYKLDDYFYNMRVKFLKAGGIKYDENNLVTFQDKLNWLIIHDTTPLKSKCADKILLHEYSKEKLGKDICNKILRIYNNAKEIKFDELPNQFALKTNHGSQYNIIVNDKEKLDRNSTIKTLNKWIQIDYGDFQKEFHYSFIKPKIFIEEFLGEKLKNYKFLCYNGIPKYVYVSIKDENNNKYRNFYDMDWNFINFHCLSQPHPTYKYDKPKLFEEMKELSKKLSADFRFVRVDLYELENEIRLGELTFAPMNSMFYCKNKQDEIELGKDINTTIT